MKGEKLLFFSIAGTRMPKGRKKREVRLFLVAVGERKEAASSLRRQKTDIYSELVTRSPRRYWR